MSLYYARNIRYAHSTFQSEKRSVRDLFAMNSRGLALIFDYLLLLIDRSSGGLIIISLLAE